MFKRANGSSMGTSGFQCNLRVNRGSKEFQGDLSGYRIFLQVSKGSQGALKD